MLWTTLKWAKCIILIDNFWSVKISGLKWFIHPFQELTKREIEYIALSRDTTESDLKQRREISSGTAYYVDQCAVRAATKGRVLLLEGIEKAERNVLPVLNNLLENRLVRSGIYFMILIFIFWLLLFFLRKAFAEKVFIGYQYFCLTYFLLYFFKGDAIRGWKIPDGSWKIWFSFKSKATADFEWILLLRTK